MPHNKAEGEHAVERDIQRVYYSKWVDSNGDEKTVFHPQPLDPSVHQSHRDKRGRVRKVPRSERVPVSEGDLLAYITKIKAHVGEAKAG